MSQATISLDNLLRNPLKLILAGATVAALACTSPAYPQNSKPETAAQQQSQRPLSASASAKLERLFDRAAAYVLDGQVSEAERIYRNILRDHPGNDRAYFALRDLVRSRELSAISIASKAAQQRLSDEFAVHQTPRFVLFSDVAAELTQQNAQWVERAHEEFDRFVADCGLRPLPLQHKLVCILFERRSDFMTFAQSQDGLANPAFTGYYSPRNDRVVFSVDVDETTSTRRARTVHSQSGADKDLLGFDPRGVDTAGAAPTDQRHAAESGCDHSGEPADDLYSPAAAKCVHEIIHQLMFHTRVMSPEVQYPLWICEGLSTAFETDRPSQPFGPDHDYAPRREAFQNMLRSDNLLPLRDLVVMTHLTSAHAHQTRSVYQQSYALVTWMCRERKDQLRNYLNAMRCEPAGRLSAARHLHLFENAFGNVDEVETAWLMYERHERIAAH